MSDQPRRRLKPADDPGYEVVDGPDAGYEVVEPPAAGKPPAPKKLAVAKRAAPKPPPPPDDEDEDEIEVEERPRRRKAKRPASWFARNRLLVWSLVGGVSLVLMVVVAGVVVPVVRAWADKPQRLAAPERPATSNPPPAEPARATPRGWVRFTAPDGSVSADLPEQPQPVNDPRLRTAEAVVRVWKTDIGGVDYLINVIVPTGPAGPGDGPVEKQLDDMARGFINSAGMGQPVSQKPCTVDGHPGRQLHFQGPTGSAVIRMTMAGRVGYIFGAMCPLPRMPADAKEATDFLDSVKLGPPPTATASPPQQQPPPSATTPGGNRPTSPLRGIRKRP